MQGRASKLWTTNLAADEHPFTRMNKVGMGVDLRLSAASRFGFRIFGIIGPGVQFRD